MHKLATQFASFCLSNLDLTEGETYYYKSLPICIIDCVYSLRAKYFTVTLPIVERYANTYMGGDPHATGDTISQFLKHIDELGGPKVFADKIAKNHQVLGGKAHIAKEDVCIKIAQYLSYLHIETLQDFQQFESQELLEIVLRAVKGLGDAGVNYLFMLAGDSDRCKPDVHIHRCIQDACDTSLSGEECQILFTDTVALLRNQYPKLTVRMLDGIIWRKYQAQS